MTDRPSSSPSVVVFDLGGVLIDWNPRYLYRSVFEGDEEKMEWFLENVCTHEWNVAQDAGRSFAEAVRVLAEQHPEHEDLIRLYYDRWEEMLGGPIEGTVEILAELRALGHPLYALTNWSAEGFPAARRLYPFLTWFDGIVVSGEIKMIKPHPEIYHHLLETHRLRPETAVFIDDREENVAAARALGFHGIVFQDPPQLRRDLEALGLLPVATT